MADVSCAVGVAGDVRPVATVEQWISLIARVDALAEKVAAQIARDDAAAAREAAGR